MVHEGFHYRATGGVPPKEETLLPMVRFCYVFTLLILAFSVVIPPIFTMFPENVYDKLARGHSRSSRDAYIRTT